MFQETLRLVRPHCNIKHWLVGEAVYGCTQDMKIPRIGGPMGR